MLTWLFALGAKIDPQNLAEIAVRHLRLRPGAHEDGVLIVVAGREVEHVAADDHPAAAGNAGVPLGDQRLALINVLPGAERLQIPFRRAGSTRRASVVVFSPSR